MSSMTPQEIVHELDKHIVGQDDAKRAVAIALRNRWRRQQVAEPLRQEITPKNILMIGPTGVGKTEIARRLARLAQSPVVQGGASEFTGGGCGRRGRRANARLLALLLPPTRPIAPDEDPAVRDQQTRARERFREQLRAGQLDGRVVD